MDVPADVSLLGSHVQDIAFCAQLVSVRNNNISLRRVVVCSR